MPIITGVRGPEGQRKEVESSLQFLCHVVHPSLKLLGVSNPPASAFGVAESTDAHH